MHEDTIHLLGDCTAGIHMAVSTIDGMLPRIHDQTLRQKLRDSVQTHQLLQAQARTLLHQCGGEEKEPTAMAKSMSWLKTNARMALNGDDTTVAYLVADGCDMGVKALCRSRNRYAGADKQAKAMAEQLIDCEEKLSASMRPFL